MILIDVSRNHRRVNFLITKVISVSPRSIDFCLLNRKVYIRYKLSWVVQVNRRILYGNSPDKGAHAYLGFEEQEAFFVVVGESPWPES